MNLKSTVLVIALLGLLTNCTEFSSEEELTATINITATDLSNGVSPLLTDEAAALFTTEDLKEIDELTRFPENAIDFRDGTTVTVPAGSNDALADAIAEAGDGGTVILESGMHYESGTVVVDQRVHIKGEEDAVLQVDTKPIEVVGTIQPALHLLDVSNVVVSGIKIQPVDDIGGTAILIEHADKTMVQKSTLESHQFGILVEQSNRVRIGYNTIVTSDAWTTGEVGQAHGIVVINGKRARVYGNEVSSSFFGVWACDNSGLYIGNKTYQNYLGLILCKVPDQAYPFPDDSLVGSASPANQWLVMLNTSHDNLDAGYIAIDGANNNYIWNNKAANNGTYDIELAGDSERFGFLTPTSSENHVLARPGITVKDCGIDNSVSGGEDIDTTADSCY